MLELLWNKNITFDEVVCPAKQPNIHADIQSDRIENAKPTLDEKICREKKNIICC